jgi:hypothetical protein
MRGVSFLDKIYRIYRLFGLSCFSFPLKAMYPVNPAKFFIEISGGFTGFVEADIGPLLHVETEGPFTGC